MTAYRQLIIIGFTGKKGAGKNEASDIACDYLLAKGYAPSQVSFSKPLKKMCHKFFQQAYGVPRWYFYGDQKAKETVLKQYGLEVSARDILQHVGTAGLRGIVPDFFVDCMSAYIDRVTAHGCNAILIDDVRFENEAELVRKRGGVVVRLKGKDDDSGDAHASETALVDIKAKYTIDNRARDREALEQEMTKILGVLTSNNVSRNRSR